MKSKDIKNLDSNVLSWFRTTRNGLLTPDGELLPVAMWDHLKELRRRPELEEMILQFEEEVSDAQYEFESGIGEDEHPAWHQFESWEIGHKEDLRVNIMDKAYQLGWGRIAFMQKRPKPHLVELETHPNTVQALQPYAQNVAELCDADLRVHETEKSFANS